MKKIYIILISIVLLFVVFAVARNFIVKVLVEVGASRVLGTAVHIDGMSIGILKPSVRIKGLKVENPSGFPSGILVDVEEAGVDYDLPQIMKGTLHLPMVVLNIKEMNLVRNEQGKLNVDALSVVQKNQGKSVEQVKETTDKPGKPAPMQIDTLTLNLGQVTLKNYAQNPPSTQNFNLSGNKTYHNITSAQQLAVLVMVEQMKLTSLRDAAIYGVSSVLNKATSLPSNLVNGIFGQIQKTLK